MRPSIAVITPLFPPGVRGGGPIRTLGALVRHAPDWADVHVFTRSRDHGESTDMVETVNRPTAWEGVTVTYAQTHRLSGAIALVRGIRKHRPNVLYLNSYWSLPYSQAVMLLRRLGVFGSARAVIAPRGELAPEALGHHAARKRAVRTVNRLLGTHQDVVWHASSEQEAADVRAFVGPDAPVVVRENDSLLPERALPAPVESEAGPLRCIFLGRLVEHKGAEVAVRAVVEVGPQATLDVFGPEEDADYADRCRTAAAGADGRVRFLGTVANDDVRETLREYDLLLLPTRSENFGHVIAEALSASVPVVVPDVTPWTERLQQEGAGEIVERSVAGVASAVRSRAEQGADARARGRHAAGRAYEAWRGESLRLPHLFELLKARGVVPERRSR